MAHPVYVLLSEGREWSPLAGTTSQSPAAVRWYLRQSMPEAATQTVVLVEGDEIEVAQRIALVVARAEELGGVVIDGPTQQLLEPGTLGEHARA